MPGIAGKNRAYTVSGEHFGEPFVVLQLMLRGEASLSVPVF
jgi:hypothetical protein